MNEFKTFLGMWALFGYFLTAFLPKTKGRKSALLQLFICGPFCWILFIPVSICVLLNKKRN